jgi:uncharacterized protein
MQLVRPATLTDFVAQASPFLLEHEAEHGLMLGVALATETLAPTGYCALVTDGGGVVGTALRTGARLIVSRQGAAGAMALIAADSVHPECYTVLGPEAAVDDFVASSPLDWRRGMTQGIYENRHVIGGRAARGQFRAARSSDRDVLAQWSQRLHEEALADAISLESASTRMDEHIGNGRMYVWESDGHPVSMAAAVAPSPHGIRINNVYTPAEQRGRGYATALVSALTQALLDGGRELVFLHTDMANATSNAIYVRVGYTLVGRLQVYSLKRQLDATLRSGGTREP